MNDVQHLRELILGLAILSPIGCQSPPASPDPGAEVEQRAPAPGPAVDAGAGEVDASAEPDAGDEVVLVDPSEVTPPVEQGSPEVDAAVASVRPVVERARSRGEAVSGSVSRSRNDPVGVMMSQTSPYDALAVDGAAEFVEGLCISPKQVYAIQKKIYDEESARWKEYKERYGDGRVQPPKGLAMSKPRKPSRKINACPSYLTTRLGSPSRCGMVGGVSWRLESQIDDGDMLCCYQPPSPTGPRRPCGRLFYVEDRATRAQTQEARGWMGADVEAPTAFGEEAVERAAHAWLEDALEEHASIAAFSRATLELMALGAPSELLAEYQRASLDEIRHARACFALVAALTGEDVSADRIAVEGPRDDLDAIISDVFWGGCVGESVAALCAQRALRGCAWEPARAALEEISGDEARHAALAWSTLSFLGEVEPERVRRVLSAVEAPRREVAAGGEVDEAWVALGRLTPAQEARAEADAWEHLILPMRDALLQGA